MRVLCTVVFIFTCVTLSRAQVWISTREANGVPANVKPHGYEANKDDLFIIRGEINGIKVIGKYNNVRKSAHIPFSGYEFGTDYIDFFAATNVKWVSAADGILPAKSVTCIKAVGNTRYIGRVLYRGSMIPGTIDPSRGALFVPYNAQELKFTNYEQLVYL